MPPGLHEKVSEVNARKDRKHYQSTGSFKMGYSTTTIDYTFLLRRTLN